MYKEIVISDALREQLQKPLGEVIATMPKLPVDAIIVTVGDVVTQTMLENGTIPNLAIIDHHTKRAPLPKLARVSPDAFRRILKFENPPGTIAGKISDFLAQHDFLSPATLLEIDGEEDLLTIPVCQFAPRDTHIFYGQPNEGIVHIINNSAFRSRFKHLPVY